MPSYCKTCGQPIRVATTTNGKKIALIPSPDPQGTYAEVTPGTVRQLGAIDIDVAHAEGTHLWAHHKTACTGESSTGTPCPPHLRDVLGLTKGVSR